MKTGIIDIGSNSVRMAWVDGKPNAGTLPQERLRYSRFAENATTTGMLNEVAVGRTIEAIQSLLQEAADNGVTIGRISATSALREAGNREAVKAYMEDVLGREITILRGVDEARFSYEGAVFGLKADNRKVAVLDVGGGSTELCWGVGQDTGASVPVGAVRLKEAAAHIGPLAEALAPLSNCAPKGDDVVLVGVGGTLTTMAAIFESMESYMPQLIHHKSYLLEDIEALNARIKAMPVEERVQLPGVTKGRADILTEGLDIAVTVMKALKANALTVSTTDLLFGQLMSMCDE